MKKITLAIFFATITYNAFAQDTCSTSPWSFHFQLTDIIQNHDKFNDPYKGLHSFQSVETAKNSLTSTFFIGRRLWKNSAVYFNPEIAGGEGSSGAQGIAGFTNGETFRIGDPKPIIYVGRAYLQQTIPLSASKAIKDDGVNQLKTCLPENYIRISAGKFSIADFFDLNSYSHDARGQFLNWALMSNGAWDYPANTRGYTYGVVAEYFAKGWGARYGFTLEPVEANGPVLDKRYTKAGGHTFELDKKFSLSRKEGVVRVLLFYNVAPMGNYKQVLMDTSFHNDITQSRKDGRTKYGFGLNAEQKLGDKAGVFARYSWNDGKNETWAFTEIDRSISAGVVFNSFCKARPNDVIGIAALKNDLSADHKSYIASGGYGFIIGDGKLNYSSEYIVEAYYLSKINTNLFLTADYQFVANPAYNKDRGPVNVFALRMHIEF